MHDEPVDILVVEDNDSERTSIVDALLGAISNVRVMAVHNGTDALDFLFARAAWTARVGCPPPKLILMDLEMPGLDGISLLGQIRSIEPEDALTLTPVVVFTSSSLDSDVESSYRCGANSYIIKPLSYPDFQAVVERVAQYWMTDNRVKL